MMLTSEPSRTARVVAAVRLHAPRVEASYGDPAAAELVERTVAAGAPLPTSSMAAYLIARTWFFDQLVVDAIERGVRQIVTAAAGYDTRAIRYAHDDMAWFELDHPATQTDKRAYLEELDVDVSRIMFVAADFTVDDVAARLGVAGCNPDVPSLVLAEGIAVYLSVRVLARLLDALRRSVATGSRLGISMSIEAETAEQQLRRSAFQQRVAAVGEPARTVLTATDSADLLAAAGWQLDAPLVDPAGAPGRTGLVTAIAVG